jgi:excisionase family DNA binding protein
MAQKPLLTVRETAEMLKVREATVRTWIRDNQLRAIKFGRDWRVREDDLEEFLEARANIRSATPRKIGLVRPG